MRNLLIVLMYMLIITVVGWGIILLFPFSLFIGVTAVGIYAIYSMVNGK